MPDATVGRRDARCSAKSASGKSKLQQHLAQIRKSSVLQVHLVRRTFPRSARASACNTQRATNKSITTRSSKQHAATPSPCLISICLTLQERRRLGLKFPRTIFLPDDETNVRQMIILYETMQALPEVDESASSIAERRCMSSPAGGGGPSTSGSVRGRGGGTAGSRPSSGGGPFDQLAPGRSPVMRRRTLPSPTKTPRGAKTI